MPADFGLLKLGPIAPEVARLLDAAEMVKDQSFGGLRHQLFRSEHAFDQGVWRCEIEVADNRILAWARSYQSAESPVLDRGEQIGSGRFLVITS